VESHESGLVERASFESFPAFQWLISSGVQVHDAAMQSNLHSTRIKLRCDLMVSSRSSAVDPFTT
jgi:hypothetical protein